MRRALDRGRSSVTAMVDEMTPGQRWTGALMLMMATLVLAFGLPSETIVQRSAAEQASPAPPRTTTTQPREVQAEPTFSAAPVPLPVVEDETPPPTSAAPAPTPEPAPQRPQIVAVVRSDATKVGRDDAAIAAAFLDSAQFDATVIELTDDDTMCPTVVENGQVVIASHGLPAHLRDCLVDRGITIIAYDALGGLHSGTGQVISTRRGDRASLVDLGQWAVENAALGANPGLVASAEYRVEVSAAVDDLARLGIEFSEVRYVPDGAAREPEILDGVRAFADAGIDTVLFAADVDDQARWVELQRLFGTPTPYVVSDVGDAVVEEGYPTFFTDAVAHTSLRTPWWERRDAGASAAQTACRSHWEDNAPPGTPPSASEVLLAYLWCQHAWLMVEPALDLVDAGTEFTAAIRGLELDSPVTSELGRFSLFEWGPRHDAVLAWSGDCSCWQPERGFRPR